MKIHIVSIPSDCECQHVLCPACGREVIIEEDAGIIRHIKPPCEWFEQNAAIANALTKIARGAYDQSLN